MRLSVLRMKTCAALNGADDSTVPDKLAVPAMACAAGAGVAATGSLAQNMRYAIATLPNNAPISIVDLGVFQLRMIVLPEIVTCSCIVDRDGPLQQQNFALGSSMALYVKCHVSHVTCHIHLTQ